MYMNTSSAVGCSFNINYNISVILLHIYCEIKSNSREGGGDI